VDETALIGACMHGHLDVAELLLRLGARTNTTDGHGCTPMMRAAVTVRLARISVDTRCP
jgi:ankyrin repeat protein